MRCHRFVCLFLCTCYWICSQAVRTELYIMWSRTGASKINLTVCIVWCLEARAVYTVSWKTAVEQWRTKLFFVAKSCCLSMWYWNVWWWGWLYYDRFRVESDCNGSPRSHIRFLIYVWFGVRLLHVETITCSSNLRWCSQYADYSICIVQMSVEFDAEIVITVCFWSSWIFDFVCEPGKLTSLGV